LAQRLIEETCRKQAIQPGQLTIHADRGSSMTSKPVAFLLADLGVTKTHSRPHTSNDNPFSEAQFKTLKYRPDFPQRFGSIEEARSFCQSFFSWYNQEHHHAGIGLLTPHMLHYGQADQVLEARRMILHQAYQANPERFVNGPPKLPPLPGLFGSTRRAQTTMQARQASLILRRRCLKIVDTFRQALWLNQH